MKTGWLKLKNGNDPVSKEYYFGDDGVMKTGWFTMKDKTYYFGDDGIMRKGSARINGESYWFGTDGVLDTNEYI